MAMTMVGVAHVWMRVPQRWVHVHMCVSRRHVVDYVFVLMLVMFVVHVPVLVRER